MTFGYASVFYKVSMYSRDKNCRMTSKKWKGREFTVAVKAVRASICSLRVHRREKSLKFRSTFGDDSDIIARCHSDWTSVISIIFITATTVGSDEILAAFISVCYTSQNCTAHNLGEISKLRVCWILAKYAIHCRLHSICRSMAMHRNYVQQSFSRLFPSRYAWNW